VGWRTSTDRSSPDNLPGTVLDREREQQAARIAEAEAIVSEWTAPPDVDAALDFYTGLLDLVQGKVRQARGTSN
jgi:hypothetical protein